MECKYVSLVIPASEADGTLSCTWALGEMIPIIGVHIHTVPVDECKNQVSLRSDYDIIYHTKLT